MTGSHLLFVALSLALLSLVACQEADEDAATAASVPVAATSSASRALPTQGERLATTSTPRSARPTLAPASATSPAEAGAADADVLFVRAVQAENGSWTFHVTVRHPDTGWADYADGWDVVTPDGMVVKRDPGDDFTRLLLHPHENEQPFTRSQSGLTIPGGAGKVTVRAHDLVDGFGGKEVTVDLTATSGPDFEVERP